MTRAFTGTLLAGALLFAPLAATRAQQPKIAPQSAQGGTPSGQSFSDEQLLPLTVHQAWLLSGKNEATFFQMVTQLAEMSAKNREVTLPETAEAGRRVGELIKAGARQDTDQLLYAVVDGAVRKVTHAAAVPAGTRK
jgi:hypothetical protein